MNEALECWTISGAFSFNHSSNSSCRLLESRFNGGLGNATFLLVGHEAGMELANWFHDASVEECLQCSDDVPLPPMDGVAISISVLLVGALISRMAAAVSQWNRDEAHT
jgi:hypothetical protein